MPITSTPQSRNIFDSAWVENCGPSMQMYVPAAVNRGAGRFGGAGHQIAQHRAKRIGESDVDDQPRLVEEARIPLSRSVEELVGHDDVQRLDLLLHASHGADGDQPLDAQRLETPDVGFYVQTGWRNCVALAVPRQKRYGQAVQLAGDVIAARTSKRRVHGQRADVGEALHFVESAAADNPQPRRGGLRV